MISSGHILTTYALVNLYGAVHQGHFLELEWYIASITDLERQIPFRQKDFRRPQSTNSSTCDQTSLLVSTPASFISVA